jgi:CRISPR-associated autoregulator DevR family
VNNGEKTLTHVAGTFLIQASGAFLNGAGLGQGEDRNVTIPKTFRDGRNEIPYVSAQAWKRWLRVTAIAEAGWPASEPQAIGWNPRGNVNKIAGQLNPVDFPEDDIFGYMRAQEGQGTRRPLDEDQGEDEAGDTDSRTKAVMRSSPFVASLLMSIRSSGWRGQDEGFVHLTKFDAMALAEAETVRFLTAIETEGKEQKKKEIWRRLEDATDTGFASTVKSHADKAEVDEVRQRLSERAGQQGKNVNFIQNATSPLPYSTRFYNTHLQGVFCLQYGRLGVFWNLGDRIELDPTKVREYLETGKIEDVTGQEPYRTLSQGGRLGKVYQLVAHEQARKQRATDLFKALSVLRGGAKQAQFATDIAPKVLVVAGLTCGNPIFNHLFKDDPEGPIFEVEVFREVLRDYSDRIVTPAIVGIRRGYLKNEDALRALNGVLVHNDANDSAVRIEIMTPIEAASRIAKELPPADGVS